jgi:hypothetical protein
MPPHARPAGSSAAAVAPESAMPSVEPPVGGAHEVNEHDGNDASPNPSKTCSRPPDMAAFPFLGSISNGSKVGG